MRSLLALLALLAPALAVAAPPRLHAMLQKHCARCHDGDEAFDLKRPPDASDERTWVKIQRAVVDARMPPAKQEGTIAERFPMDPADRAELVAELEQFLGATHPPAPRPIHLSGKAWRGIVREILSQVLTPDATRAILRRPLADSAPDRIDPVFADDLEQLAIAACRALTKAELAHPARARHFLPDAPPQRPRELDRWRRDGLRALYLAIFHAPAPAAEEERDQRLFADYVRLAKRWDEGWTAMCTTYLSGPKLLYLYAGAGQDDHE